jgi:hypothetical protein
MIVVHVGAVLCGVGLIIVAIVLFVTSAEPGNATGQAASLLWVRFVTLPIGFAIAGWGAQGIYVASRRSGHAKSKPKTVTADDKLRIYESTDSRSALVAEVPEGTPIEPGVVSEIDGIDWTTVKLADGKQGYVLGRLQYYEILKAALQQVTPVYESLLADSVMSQLPAGTELEINSDTWDAGNSKVGAWLADGKKVFIGGNTKIKWL